MVWMEICALIHLKTHFLPEPFLFVIILKFFKNADFTVFCLMVRMFGRSRRTGRQEPPRMPLVSRQPLCHPGVRLLAVDAAVLVITAAVALARDDVTVP